MQRVIEDLKACSGERKKDCIRNFFLNTNFHCVLLYRISRFFYRNKLTLISQLLKFLGRVIYSVDIDFRADLAGGFTIIHGIGIVIGAAVKSLGPIKIYQGVTLGGNNSKERCVNGEKVVQPILKGNNILYANSCVFGPVIIGENTVVGAGTVITKDISDEKIVFKKQELIIKEID